MQESIEENMLIGKRSRPNYKLARVSGPLLYKLKNRTKYDKHCWICHMQCTTVFCRNCTRSYHASCVARSFWMQPTKCSQCKSMDKSKLDCQKCNLTQTKLNQLLKLLLNRFRSKGELEELNVNMDYESLIEIMDFNIINSKIFDSKYESIEHFMCDIKRLQHNCYIMHSDNEEMIELVKSFRRFCENEIYDIDLCAECYERKCIGVENVKTGVCSVPHLVVWAQMKGYPYWPAKVVAVTKKMVEVIFFGQHDTARILYTKCMLFSKKSPNIKLANCYETDFNDSYAEANRYIENVKNIFGTYHVPTKPATFCATQMDVQRARIIESIQNQASTSSNNNL